MKSRIKSKTHWFNAIVAVLAVVETQAHLLQSFLPVNSFQALTFVLVVGNAILREVTKTAVGKVDADV